MKSPAFDKFLLAILMASMVVLILTLGLSGLAVANGLPNTQLSSDSPAEQQGEVSASSNIITFGIVPQQSSTELASKWDGLIETLSDRTGYDIRFATAPNIPEFESRLSQQKYDLAYMNPFHYIKSSQAMHYKAVAKEANRSLKGIIVVNRAHDISSLDDLNGQRIAFPAPYAFAATMVVQSELTRRGIRFKPVYVRSHDSVYLNINKGFFIAGGGIQRTLETAPVSAKQNLRILFESQGYTPHAFAVSTSLDEDVVLTLQRALIEPLKPEILADIGMTKLESANDSDWNSVRELFNDDQTLIKN